MKTVIVASLNPVKIEAARLSFKRAFPTEDFKVDGVAAASGVSNQPSTDEETRQGAFNRLHSAKALSPGADYYMAFEGGVEDKEDYLEEFAWAAVMDTQGKIGRARGAAFVSPASLRELVINQGMEVGDATDIIFNQENSKQKIGIVGHLTNSALTRTEYYVQTGIFALIPFINPELYK